MHDQGRAYYDAATAEFLAESPESILGKLVAAHSFETDLAQRGAWQWQIEHLKAVLSTSAASHVFLEFAIPRMGKRVDCVLVVGDVIAVIEYKVHATSHTASASRQCLDYALDLKAFHAGSHSIRLVPVVVSTHAHTQGFDLDWFDDGVAHPIHICADELASCIDTLARQTSPGTFDARSWADQPYEPTPTIVEAARAIYAGHNVREISRSDAGADNLVRTAACLREVARTTRVEQEKSICFVTGVPGSGKTLVGLDITTNLAGSDKEERAVFLSGNDPLVKVLREALARDDQDRTVAKGEPVRISAARQRVSSFIQNIRHFRNEYWRRTEPPVERIVVFDEAQRAWTAKSLSNYMKERRGVTDNTMSEPEFLLSVMDRHEGWSMVVCLVGGGQEINTGEAGLPEWFAALGRRFDHWRVYSAPEIENPEYSWESGSQAPVNINIRTELHLASCVRSFRSDRVASLVRNIVVGDEDRARQMTAFIDRYPIRLTRDLGQARAWLRDRARGNERFGLVASSGAYRLRPHGITVKLKLDPCHWFLAGRDDVRSSFQLEDVATEFDIQGLELDWVGVCWDGDFRFTGEGWQHFAFRGSRWTQVKDELRQRYLTNAYRVLLTRARQGMVIFVPEGSAHDTTRAPDVYDGTFEFLRRCGLREVGDSVRRTRN